MMLVSLPCDLIECDNRDFIVSRGVVSIKFFDPRLLEVVGKILKFSSIPIERTCLFKLFPEHLHLKLEQLLDTLIENRLMQEVGSGGHDLILKKLTKDPEYNFYWNFRKEKSKVHEILRTKIIHLVGQNIFSEKLMLILKQSGFKSISISSIDSFKKEYAIDRAIDCLVVVEPFNDYNLLRNLNVYCLERKISYLPVLISNLRGYIGPYVENKQSVCFECMSRRYFSNHENSYAQQFSPENKMMEINGFHPCMTDIISGFVCIRLINHFLCLLEANDALITEICFISQTTSVFELQKIPGCSFCSKNF